MKIQENRESWKNSRSNWNNNFMSKKERRTNINYIN